MVAMYIGTTALLVIAALVLWPLTIALAALAVTTFMFALPGLLCVAALLAWHLVSPTADSNGMLLLQVVAAFCCGLHFTWFARDEAKPSNAKVLGADGVAS